MLDALRQLTLLSDVSREIGKDIPEEQIDTETDGEINFLLPSIGTLNTQSSPSLAANVSTDTASECGSSFNSPNQIQQQPSSSDLANSAFVKDFSRLVVVKMSAQSTDDGIFHSDVFPPARCFIIRLASMQMLKISNQP